MPIDWKFALAGSLLAASSCVSAPPLSQGDAMPEASRIAPAKVALRSDASLKIPTSAILSPRAMSEDNVIGCESGMRVGAWSQIPASDGQSHTDTILWHFAITGALHCGMRATAWTSMLEDAKFEGRAVAIRLGNGAPNGPNLFAWQLTVGDKTNYLLLASSDGAFSKHFDILDPDCALGRLQNRPSAISIFGSQDCWVDTLESLIATAQDAATRSPLGTLEYVGPIH